METTLIKVIAEDKRTETDSSSGNRVK